MEHPILLKRIHLHLLFQKNTKKLAIALKKKGTNFCCTIMGSRILIESTTTVEFLPQMLVL